MTMRGTKVVGFVGVLASTAIIVVGAEKDGLGNWRRVISTNDFKKNHAETEATEDEPTTPPSNFPYLWLCLAVTLCAILWVAYKKRRRGTRN